MESERKIGNEKTQRKAETARAEPTVQELKTEIERLRREMKQRDTPDPAMGGCFR